MCGFKGVSIWLLRAKSQFVSSSFTPSAGPEQGSVLWELGVFLKVMVLVCRQRRRQSYPDRYTHPQVDPNSKESNCKKWEFLESTHLFRRICILSEAIPRQSKFFLVNYSLQSVYKWACPRKLPFSKKILSLSSWRRSSFFLLAPELPLFLTAASQSECAPAGADFLLPFCSVELVHLISQGIWQLSPAPKAFL